MIKVLLHHHGSKLWSLSYTFCDTFMQTCVPMSAYPKYKRMGSRYGRSEEEAFLLHPADPFEDSGMRI